MEEMSLSEGWIAFVLNLVEKLGDKLFNGEDGSELYLELERKLDELSFDELKIAFKTLAGKYIGERNVRRFMGLARQIEKKLHTSTRFLILRTSPLSPLAKARSQTPTNTTNPEMMRYEFRVC